MIEKLFESHNTLIYRAFDDHRDGTVVVKMLKGEYPSPESIASLLWEYKILKDLNLEGVIKVYGLEKSNNRPALIMEDFGALSLDKILEQRNLSLEEFLKLAIKLSTILGEIHKNNIIHKDINPSNILWNTEKDKLKVIDFEISAVLPREVATTQNPNILEGTLAYISPERTGRMNRLVDYRTDLYSLGVTFYEMLTRQLPFWSNNALELIHCHIAKDPVSPHKLIIARSQEEQESLEIISKIILKLIAKNAEERYQSAYGLKVDLENCLEQLETSGKIGDFKIAGMDFSGRFQIPQVLYGREREIELLKNSFNASFNGAKEMMIVTGYAGIGKSALVNEIHKSIVARHGFFISGKFEQFKRNIPYYSIIQAFQQLIKQILTESEEQISEWREKIHQAISPNGQVIIDVIPELELIIGKQPPVPELPSQESQNRLILYFKNFIRTFTDTGYPLTIFLDDLQWIDLPSLNLIEIFMTDSETKHLLLIAAFRDDEVDSGHPLLNTIDKIQKAGTPVNTLSLSPLNFTHVNNLLSDTLKCAPEKTYELAKLCMKKTYGNPFFLKQFLQRIYEDQLFEFDNKRMIWHWEIGMIEKMTVTDNVVNLMVTKIHKLSENTQTVLKIASCIGNRFNLRTLSQVYEKSPALTATDLWEALREELIFPMSDDYKFIHTDVENVNVNYKFSHDRIQHAIYSLIEENEKKGYHLKIGRLLLSDSVGNELEDNIFTITNQLNYGLDLITGKKEREELARLNFKAGGKAKSANAYEIAFQYFTRAISLLEDNCWGNQYELATQIYTEGAEASYLTGDFIKMEELAGEVLENSRSIFDKIRINEIIIHSYIARARLKEAVTIAIDILKELGVHIAAEPKRINVMMSVIKVRLVLVRLSLTDLNALPQMRDERMIAAMRILMIAASSAYYGNTLISISMALKMVYLSVRYGNSPFSPYGYALYGIILQAIIGNISLGYQFGKFSIDLLNKFNAIESYARMNFIFHAFIKHWKDKLSDTIEPLSESYQRGLETGDYEFASYCSAYIGIHSLHSGIPLELAEKEMKKSIELIKKLNQEIVLIPLRMNSQAALNLMEPLNNSTHLVGEHFNEEESLPKLIKVDIADVGIMYTLKVMLSVIFNKREECLKYALEAEKFKDPLIGLFFSPLLRFYTSLAFLSSLSSVNWLRRISLLIKTYINQKRLKKWASHSPVNHLHKWYLVEAERCRALGRDKKTLRYYDKSIVLARNSGFLHEEALANELAGRFCLSKDKRTMAANYLLEARYLYTKWGAKAKVRQVEEEFRDLLYSGAIGNQQIEEQAKIKLAGTTGTSALQLDLETLQKVSQTISSEIHLEKLLEKLLRILIASAGAEKGYILLKEGNKIFLEGEAYANTDKVIVLQHIPLGETRDLAQLIINYVLRTNETVTLEDTGVEELFNSDEYIIRAHPKSLFCMPLIYQNKLSGILYLENNLMTGAFNAQRVELLKMLCGQIVISIENAALYRNLEEYNRNLEEKVKTRTAEIALKNEQLNIQTEELHTTLENLRHSQAQLIQSEKMASLGQLVAGIAHEINNPVNFISAGVDSLYTNLEEIRRVLNMYNKITIKNVDKTLKEIEELKEKIGYKEAVKEIVKLIQSIKNGTYRTTEIIKGLRTFSHLDEDLIQTADLHEGLDSTLVLLRNRYKNRIEIEKKYADIPAIECYPDQLNQVFMNILSNAIDAIDNEGIITISTSVRNDQIQISICDTGKGIPDMLKDKIFEPFFTTKEVGKGTGLGLSISHGIIEKHRGSISFKSEVGKGSEFIINLPVKQGKIEILKPDPQ